MEKFTTYRQTIKMNGTKVDLLLETGPFNPKGHVIKTNADGNVVIDGLLARGTDSIPPKAVCCVRRFEVRWNGRRVPIQDKDWKWLLDVFPKKSEYSDDDSGTVYLLAGDDRKSILVAIDGGRDGAGVFKTWWVIRETGVVATFTQGPP